MKKISSVSILALGLAGLTLSFGACSGSGSSDRNPVEFTSIQTAKTYRLVGSDSVYQRGADLVFYDSVAMLMPSVIHKHDIKPLQDAILKIAFDSISTDYKELMTAYFEESLKQTGFNAEQVENDTIVFNTADGYNLITGNVVNLSADLLVYCISDNIYIPGAAHGMSTRNYINYNITEGKLITLSDLFTPAGLKTLPSVIARQAAELSAVFGPTDITALPSEDNFYISAQGDIVFVYQPFEVASYAQGFINVPFYPYELVDYMTADAIKYFNLQDLND